MRLDKKNELDDYLFTLEICVKNLPENTDVEHYKRIREIKEILAVVLKNKR